MAKIPFIPINLPPGVVRNGTPYQVGAAGRWNDASQVRWLDNILQPVGGWLAVTTAPLAHPARGIIAWRTNSGLSRFYALGTSTQLIVGDGSSLTFDITPAGFTAGNDNAVDNTGYGGGGYGSGTWGTPRQNGNYVPPTTWSFDMWGDNLVACSAPGDGKIYQWALSTGTAAAAVANAPVNNTGIVVTDQQHLMALGAGGNARLVQWSDASNNTLWTPAATNEAGQLPLVTQGVIVGGVRVRREVLVLTTMDAWAFQYIGQPFIWTRNKVGEGCGLIGANAIVEAGGRVFWMSDKRFWFYDGASVQELPCDVANFVFNNMNTLQAGKVAAGSNAAFEEVWWHYPSQSSNEPDRYVSYNYRNGFWMIGALGRTCWCDKGAFQNPFAVGTDGYVYAHEYGTLANGATRVGSVYATTGALELQQYRGGVSGGFSAGGGDHITEVNQILTDELTLGDTQLTFTGKYTPNGPSYSYGPFTVRSDGYMDTRLSGRQLTMTVTPVNDNAWQLGQMRWDARQTSGR